MKYTMEVGIVPARHYMRVKCSIEGSIKHDYFLNENFRVLSASSNGADVAFLMDMKGSRPPFDEISRPISFDAKGDLQIVYEGYITDVIFDVNQIEEDTVELSSYSGWYPKPETAFAFDVTLALPEGYKIIANGRQTGAGRFVSVGEVTDIAIFASNAVERFAYASCGVRCEFLCPADMLPDIKNRADELTRVNALYTEMYGEPLSGSGAAEIISVFRPSGGWGYKRGNVSFVSAEWGRTEKRYHRDFHELAHGWWAIADVAKDDWINEGGAEYSAYIASKRLYGGDFVAQYIAERAELIRDSEDKTSIVDTKSDSPERHLNHYVKTTFMFMRAAELFGEARVTDILRDFYSAHRETRRAATADFLLPLSGDERAFFSECLFAEDWRALTRDWRLGSE